jgi:hypothetical protein
MVKLRDLNLLPNCQLFIKNIYVITIKLLKYARMKKTNKELCMGVSNCNEIERYCNNIEYKEGRGKENLQHGKWKSSEHIKFLIGVIKHGNDWREIQKQIMSRNCKQARSHSQKFFAKLKKILKEDGSGGGDNNYPINVIELHEISKTLNNKDLKILLDKLIYLYCADETLPTDMIGIDEIFKKENKWIYTDTTTEITSNIQIYPNIISFIEFCNRSSWKYDCCNLFSTHYSPTNFKKEESKLLFLIIFNNIINRFTN